VPKTPKISVAVSGISAALKKLKKYPGVLNACLQEGLMIIAEEIRKTAVDKLKEQQAIDLGQLWNSIVIHRISAKSVIVGTNVEYAAVVEFGTKGHWLKIDNIPGFRNWMKHHGIDLQERMTYFYVHPKPRPYFEPAFQEGRNIAEGIISRTMNEVVCKTETAI